MITSQQVIDQYEKLPPSEKQIVFDYVMTKDIFEFQEDTDENLQEDIDKARRIKQEEMDSKVKPIPFEEVWNNTQSRFKNTLDHEI